jgi:guanylate kinase
MRQKKGILFIVSAPSGAGKSTICSGVMIADTNIRFAISHTTRAPRDGEDDGVDYHFTDLETFKRMADSGEFLEWAEVHGNYYGTSSKMLEAMLESGVDIFHDIDVQGAVQLREKLPDAVYIFILPPSIKALGERLSGRGTDSEDVIARRLDNARGEIESYSLYDYVILNDSLDEAVADFRSVISASRLRVGRVDGDSIKANFLS